MGLRVKGFYLKTNRKRALRHHDLLLVLPEAQFNPFNLNCLWTFIKQGSETANGDGEAT